MRLATVAANGDMLVWQLQCVPFGWDKACFLGQQTHHRVMQPVPRPPNTQPYIYIDDGLAMGPFRWNTVHYLILPSGVTRTQTTSLSQKSNPEAALQQSLLARPKPKVPSNANRCSHIL